MAVQRQAPSPVERIGGFSRRLHVVLLWVAIFIGPFVVLILPVFSSGITSKNRWVEARANVALIRSSLENLKAGQEGRIPDSYDTSQYVDWKTLGLDRSEFDGGGSFAALDYRVRIVDASRGWYRVVAGPSTIRPELNQTWGIDHTGTPFGNAP